MAIPDLFQNLMYPKMMSQTARRLSVKIDIDKIGDLLGILEDSSILILIIRYLRCHSWAVYKFWRLDDFLFYDFNFTNN